MWSIHFTTFLFKIGKFGVPYFHEFATHNYNYNYNYNNNNNNNNNSNNNNNKTSCYPTLLRRVQITRETSTNITQYLYSSHSSWLCERLKNLASQNFGMRNLWIINHLLDVLVGSIAVYFYSLFVF